MRRLLPHSRGGRVALGVVAAVVALNALGFALEELDPPPTGPPSSSYATQPLGVQAWARVLEDTGRSVRRVREAPAERAPDPRQALFVLDPGVLEPGDVEALVRFVERGGRLVAGGRGSEGLAGALAGAQRSGGTAPREVRVLAPVAELAGVQEVVTAGEAAWTAAGRAVPALGDGAGEALLVVADRGEGRAALLADASPLQNRLLARADNAALGLGLAGEPGRPVAFLESVHGFTPTSGLAALPGRWLAALIGLGLAALVWVGAHVRRLGPAEQPDPTVVPPRGAYVAALARTLRRTRDPHAAVAPVRHAARRTVARRAALGPQPDDGEVEAAGRRLGLAAEEAAAVAGRGPGGEEGALAAGRALATLSLTGTMTNERSTA
ncbi:MAG: DUF4350 domain-containing protein [Solirubrobacteraceae bacterium MAG38_C4-C5]|nr:DUF4350 domain-containing protein [Candidatus Siliceabacter maunaloa]